MILNKFVNDKKRFEFANSEIKLNSTYLINDNVP